MEIKTVITICCMLFLVFMFTVSFLSYKTQQARENCKYEEDNKSGHAVYKGEQYC